MKIFIIYASAGSGHKKIAESINEQAVALYRKEDVSLIDILDFTPAVYKFLYSKGYIFVISRLKWLWAILFFLSNTEYLKIINGDFRCYINKISCYGFINFIKEENPDVVISTHFLVNELVSSLKENNQIKTKLISVITDFGVHNFWIAKNIDRYVVACKQTEEILISQKINKNKIKILGIPVRIQFLRQIDKVEVIKKLGLKRKEFAVLILTGGIGIGPIYQIVKLLEDKVNVIAICGDNKKLYLQLKKLNYENLIVLGWIDYIEEVMAISDIAVTKPGGSTIVECLEMELPMIFFSLIPGQESQNAKIITKTGLGIILKKPNDIKDKVIYFRNNFKEIKEIKNKIRVFKPQDCSRNILGLINE